MNSLGKFLLAKDRNAIVIAFLCALLQIFHFPTGFIAVIIVGLVTLQKGAKSGFWILTWVALPTISLLALRHVGLFDLLFLRCIVLWLLAILLRRYQSWGLLLEIVAFVGVICILLLHLRLPNLQQWWAQELSAYIKPVIAESHWHIKITPAEFAARLSPFATGLSAFFIAVTVLLELLVARCWQFLLSNPGAFAKEFIQIRTGYVAVILACLVLVLAFLKMPAEMDAAPLVLLPFFMAGLSLLHFWVRQKKNLIYLLIIMYLGLLFVPLIVISILVILAFLDTLCNFRSITIVRSS